MGVTVTEDEADKKMAAGVWDPLQIRNRNPEFHYRWIRKSDKLNLAKKVDYLGYEIVSKDDDDVRSVLRENTPIKKAADTSTAIEVGDLVLARIPRNVHEYYRKMNAQKIKARTEGVPQSYRMKVNQAAGSNVAYEEHVDTPDMADGKGG